MCRFINEIIIHCTATAEGREVSVTEIDRWHRELGFDQIGYHYVIGLDGHTYCGRPEWKNGAHCKGHNAHSIGIAYVGGLDALGRPKDTRTPEQKEALKDLVRMLRRRYPHATLELRIKNYELREAGALGEASAGGSTREGSPGGA